MNLEIFQIRNVMEATIKQRLISFIEYKNIPVRKFEILCKLSNGYIRSLRNAPSVDKLSHILETFPDLNRIWLLTGEGEMLKSGQDGVQKEVPARNPQEVYLLPVSAQAGSLNDFVASVKKEECEKIISPIYDVDFAITVSGDSMAPEYPNGSIIFIKRINERVFINWGNVYLLDTCNGIIVKKVFPTEEAAVLQCVSINSNYPPFTVNMADIYGIYRVLLCMSVK